MHAPREPRPRTRRYSVRRQARLDAATHAKLEELAVTFPRTGAAILRYVMQWGLTHGKDWAIDRSIPAAAHLVTLLMAPDLLQPVQDAATAHGVSIAAWVRQAMREVTPADFPASWRVGETAFRSQESGYYHRRYQLRLDEGSFRRLEALTQTFHRPAADVVRQLIVQATPEGFPESWHLAVAERRHEPRSTEGWGGSRS